ncbi:hypothetical protein NECAME_18578, partial [Necator americanus]
VTTNACTISPISTNEAQKPEERPPPVNGARVTEEPSTPAAISSGVAAISLQTAVSATTNGSATLVRSFTCKNANSRRMKRWQVSPSTIQSNDLLSTAPPLVFSIPPPAIAPQTIQPPIPGPHVSPTIVVQTPPVSVPVVRQNTTIPVVQQASTIPSVVQKPPVTIIPPPPFQIHTPVNLSSPVAVQISTYSPRNRWDAPPPAMPNFAVPPPSVPPPSLVMPNLYAPNAVQGVIPLIPNISIPPPGVPPTNVPPPGWPPRLN